MGTVRNGLASLAGVVLLNGAATFGAALLDGASLGAVSLGTVSLGAALLDTAPAAQAADYYKPRIAAGDAAVRRTITAAERGNAHAQALLGFMYANGQGVPQSRDLAVDWYERSAQQGDPTGQYLLGLMYDKGFGVTADVVVAHKWLNLAAAHAPRQSRDRFELIRDAVGSKMTKAQLEVAQKLAVDFVPVRE
jgi:TPR repeat protein